MQSRFMMQWNTIDSCPVRTPVLVVANGVVQHCMMWLSDDINEDAGIMKWFPLSEDSSPWEDFYPTHWMLPPEPPQHYY